MTYLKTSQFLISNRILSEQWEDREYEMHKRRLQEIKTKPSTFNNESEQPYSYYAKQQHYISNNQNRNSINTTTSKKDSKIDNWNYDYVPQNNKIYSKVKFKTNIDIENEKFFKRLESIKGTIDKEKWHRDFILHQNVLKINEKKHYTPRGIGHRKQIDNKSKQVNKNDSKLKNNMTSVKMLNQAVCKMERGDVVLMKTLITLNYKERILTKKQYESTYETDLQKGLIKVMDKTFEPLIVALLSDKDSVDTDRIYESLYEPSDAAVVIPSAFISRNLEQKASLLMHFFEKIDSELKTEINSKIEGDLNTFLQAFLENNNLDNDALDEKKANADAKELSKSSPPSFTSGLFLDVLKTDTRKQLKQLFASYQKINGSDITNKMDAKKPVVIAIKTLQSYLNDPYLFQAEKLQKSLKTNKTEFLRLLATYNRSDLDQLLRTYNQKYQTDIEKDIEANFNEDVARLVLKMISNSASSSPESNTNENTD